MAKTKLINKTDNLACSVYDGIYSVLTIIALSTLIAPYIYTFISGSVPFAAPIAILLPSVLIVAGYLLQAGCAKLFKLKRADDNSAYEHTETFFRPGEAVVSLIFAAITGIVVYIAVSGWLNGLSIENSNVYYDRYTVIPLLIAFFAVFCMVAGTVLWFYPFNRVISVRTIIPLCMLFLIDFLLVAVFMSGTTQLFTTVCLFIFLFCAFILLNQSNVLAAFAKTKNTRATPSARLYNIAVVVIVMLLLVVTLLAVLSVITGLTVIARMIFFYVLGVVFREDESYEKASEVAENFSSEVFSGIVDSADSGGSAAKLFFLIFFVIILGLTVFFIISRRRDVWNAIKSFFNRVSQAIIDFLIGLLNPKKNHRDRYAILDYKDEEIKMDESSVRELSDAHTQNKNIYRDFLSRLALITDSGERVRFAYRTLVNCWRGASYGIEPSDTPREIRDKIIARTSENELNDVTSLFETVEYAERQPDSASSAQAVEIMSRQIRRFG